MYANSPLVVSTQLAPHRRLLETVLRHRASLYQRPIAAHSLRAFAALRECLAQWPQRPLVLDSGCGTGLSTLSLAQQYEHASVIGIDQSADRLAPLVAGLRLLAPHALLLHAPLEDIWRLLQSHGFTLQRHLIWYPNPWPKPQHLLRRWHGHPVFPSLLALGGELELRSNWRVYIDEFAQALQVFGLDSVITQINPTQEPVTPFERKYRDSGHPLWQLRAVIPRAVAQSIGEACGSGFFCA